MRHNDSGKIFAPKCTHIHIFFGFKEMKHHADPPFPSLASCRERGGIACALKEARAHPEESRRTLAACDLLNGTSEPCKLVGCEGERYAIIDIGGVLHTIHIDCLADMQSGSRTRRTEAEPDCPVYTVIDIETTGLDRQTAEIIEFGALRIENGTPSAQFSMLVQASAPVPPVCARLTGITDDMLVGQPEIREALSAFVAFIGDTPLVGQNLLDFDLPIINRICEEQGISPLRNRCCDTLLTARRCLTLSSYRLEALASALGAEQSTAHRALGDCETTYRVFERLAEDYPAAVQWARPPRPRKTAPSAPRPRVTASQLAHFQSRPKAKDIVPATDLFDPAHPLFDKTCVLTGELLKLSDREAMQRIADCGGKNADNVTKKTDLLIVGGGSPRETKNGKVRKAEEYIEKGIPIQIISEEEFLQM